MYVLVEATKVKEDISVRTIILAIRRCSHFKSMMPLKDKLLGVLCV